MKRITALLLVLVLVLGMAACGAKEETTTEQTQTTTQTTTTENAETTEEKPYYNETGYPICDEIIQITVSGCQNYTSDWNDTAMTQFIKDELGIEMLCSPYPTDSFASQYALMLANNEQPDLIINARDQVSKAQVNIDGEAGYWLDLSQYLDIMPNFSKYLEENPDWAAYTKTATGAIYSINWFKAADSYRIGGNIYINKADLEVAGITGEIKTLDDFYNALVALKAACPDKITFGVTPDYGWTAQAECILMAAHGITGTTVTNYMMAMGDDGNVYLQDITDNNREYLKFMNRLYEEGILDQECFIRTPEEYRAKEWAGEIAVFSDSGFNYPNHGDPLNFMWIPALTSDAYPETSYTTMNKVMDGVKVMVKADTEYPEAICRLIDYMFTEEGILLSSQTGIEGETFDFVTNKYGLTSTTNDPYADLENYETVNSWVLNKVSIAQAMSFLNGHDGRWYADLSNETLAEMAADTEIGLPERTEACKILAVADIENIYDAPTPLVYTAEEQQERNALYTDITNYIKTMKVSFISGEKDIEDDAEWQAFIDQLYVMGYERLMAIETEAWSRMN